MLSISLLSPLRPSALLQASEADSLFNLIERGGILMIPIGLCSLVAFAFAFERWIGLRSGALGSKKLQRKITEAATQSGRRAALEVCEQAPSAPLARIVSAGLTRASADFQEREKIVEDAANGEVRKLARNLRPLFLVWLIAPLLGLLGTVWGMIKAFKGIAGEGGIGKPEILADGIYSALSLSLIHI